MRLKRADQNGGAAPKLPVWGEQQTKPNAIIPFLNPTRSLHSYQISFLLNLTHATTASEPPDLGEEGKQSQPSDCFGSHAPVENVHDDEHYYGGPLGTGQMLRLPQSCSLSFFVVLVVETLTVAGQKRIAVGEPERRQRRMLFADIPQPITSTLLTHGYIFATSETIDANFPGIPGRSFVCRWFTKTKA